MLAPLPVNESTQLPQHIVVAMSGGVDSAVAALLLRNAGHRVTGLFMSNGVHSGEARRTCCSARDARDAAASARVLGIEFVTLDFKRAFAAVIDRFVAAYREGRTPNPCIDCNQTLKFGQLLGYAEAVGAQAVATGHYARWCRDPHRDRFYLARAADLAKDQSYVLFSLSQAQLAKIVLPLSDLQKSDVRQLAARAGLPVRDKPESQDICFVPHGDYRTVVKERSGTSLGGEIVTVDGALLAHHDGIENFTVGQRRGLGIALGAPSYVLRIEPATRRVVVGSRADLERSHCRGARASWMRHPGLAVGEALECWVQIRYRHAAAPAQVRLSGAPGCVEVTFATPQLAITPGQAMCFYGDDGSVLGGAWIEG